MTNSLQGVTFQLISLSICPFDFDLLMDVGRSLSAASHLQTHCGNVEPLFAGDDPHFDYSEEIKSAVSPEEPDQPDQTDQTDQTDQLAVGLEGAASEQRSCHSPLTASPQSPASPLSKSGSADSAVEATEDLLEDLESKVCSDDEKENVNNCVDEKNMISHCDINGDTGKRAGEESSDRRNQLAEIKI